MLSSQAECVVESFDVGDIVHKKDITYTIIRKDEFTISFKCEGYSTRLKSHEGFVIFFRDDINIKLRLMGL